MRRVSRATPTARDEAIHRAVLAAESRPCSVVKARLKCGSLLAMLRAVATAGTATATVVAATAVVATAFGVRRRWWRRRRRSGSLDDAGAGGRVERALPAPHTEEVTGHRDTGVPSSGLCKEPPAFGDGADRGNDGVPSKALVPMDVTESPMVTAAVTRGCSKGPLRAKQRGVSRHGSP